MKIIRYSTVILFCFAFIIAKAQDKPIKKVEFEVNGFYGLSGMTGKIPNGKIKPEMNPQFSVSGKYFFTESVGLGIAAGYATYSSQAQLDNYSSSTTAIDTENESFEYRVTATGIKEKQKLDAFEIPIFIALRKRIFKEDGLYKNTILTKMKLQVNLGMKISLPVNATYQCTEGKLETKGYYASNNVEYANMPNHGFETIEKISYSGNLSTTMAYSLFGNIGIAIPIGKSLGLNLGVYGSYGLNSVLKPQSKLLIDYPGTYNSLTSLSEKVSLVSGGLRIGLSF